MKKFYSIATALLLVAGTFTSCTKDLDEVGLNSSATEAVRATNANPNNNGGGSQPIETGLAIEFSNATPQVGTYTTIEAKFTAVPTSGELRIQEATGVALDGSTIWTNLRVFNLENATAPFTYDYTSNTAKEYSFRAQYVPKNGSGYKAAHMEGNVTFIAICTGANLTAQQVYANPVEGGLTEYKVAFTLTSCTEYSNVKLQGGVSATITGNVVAMSADGVEGDVRYNNNNAVVSWSELNLTPGYSNTFYVTFRMEKSDKEDPIGDWTAKEGDEVIATATL
ncbi:hypothetical protein [uncultured Pontibacter sp.]|uniref:hypothetical protein n=1 Tax=uncultured Pontibacter sp. TaxID=453356 RepID=UPI002607A2EF|nr:hypothetical protein [uncultured Pontibacter sp.]